MIRLDDEEFAANSIIDLVVYPDMPVHTIVREMTQSVGCRIILDTQGNLHPHYGSQARGAFLQDRPVSDGGLRIACEVQSHSRNHMHFRSPGDSCAASRGGLATRAPDREVPSAAGSPASGECGPPSCPGAEAGNTAECNNADTPTSSMEHVSHFIDGIDDSEDTSDRPDTQYHFISGLHSLIQKLREIRRLRNFVLVVDSITLVCDCSPFNLQYIINLLWAIVYNCNATIITINHYRIGRVRGVCRLIPRMGTRWAFFVTYQVLLSYRRNEIVFSIEEEKRTRAR